MRDEDGRLSGAKSASDGTERLDQSFATVLRDWPVDRVRELIDSRTDADVECALRSPHFAPDCLAALLSPAAFGHLERMAQASARLTRQRFGRVIQFYVPLYVSNYCINSCLYCGFNCRNTVPRQALSVEDAVREAHFLSSEGFQHLLLVAGEDPVNVPVAYFEQLVSALHDRFASINIEIYPMDVDDYARLVNAGIDSLTLYQETYDPELYAQVHPTGPKRDFRFRLEGVERGARAGVTFLGIGSLLGLGDWRVESFYVGLHARYLQQRCWRQHVSVSFPRIQPAAGAFEPPCPVSDADFAQIICALRLQLPDAGLVLSTRESARLRDNLLPMGITRLSAGSRTTPGGYSEESDAEGQFEVQDHRSLADVMNSVRSMGFDPVCKDWDASYHA